MLSTGTWHVTTGEGVYVLDLGLGEMTRLPAALTEGMTGAVMSSGQFRTVAVSPPVNVVPGEPLPAPLASAFEDTSKVAILSAVAGRAIDEDGAPVARVRITSIAGWVEGSGSDEDLA